MDTQPSLKICTKPSWILSEKPFTTHQHLAILKDKDQGEACGVMDMHGRHNGGHHVTLGPSQARVRVGLGWTLKMRLDPLESRLDKLSMKSRNVPNGVRMKKLRPFELGAIVAVRIRIQNEPNSNSWLTRTQSDVVTSIKLSMHVHDSICLSLVLSHVPKHKDHLLELVLANLITR